MNMVNYHQEGEGNKLTISTVRSIIRKWKINGTVEVKEMSKKIVIWNSSRPGEKCLEEPTHHCKRPAKKE